MDTEVRNLINFNILVCIHMKNLILAKIVNSLPSVYKLFVHILNSQSCELEFSNLYLGTEGCFDPGSKIF